MADDYYSVLGVPREASDKDIKKAFRQIARECHPDVVGDDPIKLARFKAAKDAYEVLSDATARTKYDRRMDRRGQRIRTGGSFRDAFYRRTADLNEGAGRSSSRVHRRSSRRVSDPGNNIGLDDLFNDFGFGGSGTRGTRARSSSGAPPHSGGSSGARGSTAGRGSRERARPPMPQNGRDVHIDLDVPEHIARDGGTVTAVYYRMQRADNWRPGSPDAGIVRIQDLHDVRLLAGTRDGEVLHERGRGDAGAYGGPYGDLVVRVRIVRSSHDEEPPPPSDDAAESDASPSEGASASAPESEGPQIVDIGVGQAILGGPVEVETPQGRVRLQVPPGTSSGKKLRLRGKGADGPSGPEDLVVELRIVVPQQLDEESRELMLKFAARNPFPPRD